MKFKIKVTEDVTMEYDAVEIEAESEDDARDIAEDMRCSGGLGEAQFVSVDEIYYDVKRIVMKPAARMS